MYADASHTISINWIEEEVQQCSVSENDEESHIEEDNITRVYYDLEMSVAVLLYDMHDMQHRLGAHSHSSCKFSSQKTQNISETDDKWNWSTESFKIRSFLRTE